MRIFLICFFLFNLLLSSFYLDIWPNANTTSRALPVVTYFESGTFQINKYHELTVDKAHVNGNYYTDKAPLPTYMMIPFFGLGKILGLIQPDENGSLMGNHIYMMGGFLFASLPFVVLLQFLFNKIRTRKSTISPVLLASLPFYASFVFVFTGTYFAHLLSGIFLLACYLLIRKNRYFWAGLLGGCAFLSEYNLAVILLLWGLWILLNEKKLKPFIVFSSGIAPSLLFLIYYNSIYSSSPWTFMYKHHNFSELDANYGFVLPGLEPFWGLTFSTYRGIFFFAPFLLAGVWILYRKIRAHKLKDISHSYLIIPFLIYFVFIASYFAWWGGWTYGPRLLLAMIIILVYELIVYFSKHGIPTALFAGLTIAGLIVILPAKGTIAYSAPTGIYNPFVELVLDGILQGVYNPNNILTFTTGLNPVLAFYSFLFIFISGFVLFYLWFRKWQTK